MILTPERLAEVTRPGSCYVICSVSYFSNHPEVECEAGFFSLFLRALYGIRFAINHKVPYHIDFGRVPHSYSEPVRFAGDANFWNYYFIQPISSWPTKDAITVNAYCETFPLRIWSRPFLREMNDIINYHIRLQPDIEHLVDEKKEYFKRQKVLGVHIRRTDHSIEVEPISLTSIKAVIYREISRFDKVFVATDDQTTLDAMIEEFGQRIIYNDATRSTTGAPVHRHHACGHRYELGREALLDAYCLSFCQKSILLHSNLSFAALLLNPSLNYTLLETPKHRNLRLKTLLAYHLDRFGIRMPNR